MREMVSFALRRRKLLRHDIIKHVRISIPRVERAMVTAFAAAVEKQIAVEMSAAPEAVVEIHVRTRAVVHNVVCVITFAELLNCV